MIHSRIRNLILMLAAGLLTTACLDVAAPTCVALDNITSRTSADSVFTTSGLIYRERLVGTGEAIRTTSDCQVAHVTYEVRLANGTLIDETPPGATYPVGVGTGSVIRGFDQGLIGMRVGGRRELIIPHPLGYGTQDLKDNAGNVIIPGGSTLIMQVQLVQLTLND